MLAQQKEATMTLISGVLFTLLMIVVPPREGLFRNEMIFLMLGLFIVSLWIVRRVSGIHFRNLDEMEKTIRYQAALIGVHAFGLVVMIYAFVLYLLHRLPEIVPLSQVLQMAYFSYLSLYVFWSGSILVLYRRGPFHV